MLSPAGEESYHIEAALIAAEGYADLAMFGDAWKEIESIDPKLLDHVRVLETRVYVLIRESRWEEGLDVSLELCDREPRRSAGYIHAAFCLHEMGRTEEAAAALENGPKRLRGEPIYHYNMGCYRAALGDLEKARGHLFKSFELDGALVHTARRDPDLRQLWDEFIIQP